LFVCINNSLDRTDAARLTDAYSAKALRGAPKFSNFGCTAAEMQNWDNCVRAAR
jgi:hypothetical protein